MKKGKILRLFYNGVLNNACLKKVSDRHCLGGGNAFAGASAGRLVSLLLPAVQ
ncbi:hypothetical protein [Neisseria canis]|uniref:hypothetical protein n=1 Tax=Neisseria canis TaxID=493 RepID=UPI001E4330B9|nr:hypothetical protein [Neisseria canis]